MTPHYTLVSHTNHQWIERPGGLCRLPSRYSYYDETDKVVQELNRLVDHINRLEEAGNAMVTEEDVFTRLKNWTKAKETRP